MQAKQYYGTVGLGMRVDVFVEVCETSFLTWDVPQAIGF